MLVLMVTWIPAPMTQGAVFTWNVDANGEWDNPLNWSPNTGFPNAIGDVANLRLNIGANRTITLANDQATIGGLILGDTVGNSAMVIAGSNNLIFNNGTSNAFIRKLGSATETIQTPVVLASNLDARIHAGTLDFSGSGNVPSLLNGSSTLFKSGHGGLRLNFDASAFTGNYVVNFGTLSIGGGNSANPGGLGFGTGGPKRRRNRLIVDWRSGEANRWILSSDGTPSVRSQG